VVRAFDLRVQKFVGSTPGPVISGNNLRHVVHTHTCVSVMQYNLVPVKGGNAMRLGR